ncbi:hypothetical protein B4U80_06807, partial [Leptotrombidium deliense]
MFFMNFLTSVDVEHIICYNEDFKCSIIERFHRTLKSKMFKFFTAFNTRRYIDVLQEIVQSYNNSYHSSIKMAPNE